LTFSDLRKGYGWPQPLWEKILGDLKRSNLVAVRENTVILKDSIARLPDADRNIINRLIAAYSDTGFRSPRPDELPEMVDAQESDVERLLDYLCKEGRLVRLTKNVILSRESFGQAQDMVVRIIKEQGSLDSADFKNHIGSTRKYALAILDYLDAKKVTVRVGNLRKLSPSFEKNLLN
jgi:selenocysteine-specific elongation factor